MRGRGLLRAAAAVVAAVALACAPAHLPPTRPVDPALQPFLPAPAAALGRALAPPWADLHARLLAGQAAASLAAEIDRAAGAEPDAAHLLRAELHLAAGEGAAAFAEVTALAVPARERPAVRLLEARAREAAGDVVEAYALYRGLADAAPAAARAQDLEARATDLVLGRIDAALAQGRPAEARRDLERLRAWRPRDVATLRATARVAAAQGDATSELAALRALATAGALDDPGRERRAGLELAAGDADFALAELERLAERHPGDAGIADDLDRARFGWRLGHAPERVQRAGTAGALTRGQLAQLLYWLVPGVRAGRGGVARIASDVVGHEAREEIVRVVNLGLLPVDETLHRFEPERPVRRLEALSAVLRAAALDGGVPECARAALAAGWSRENVCAGAAACGLLATATDCLPGGPLAGREALEWIRRALAAGGTRG